MMLESTEANKFCPTEDEIIGACPLLRAFTQDPWPTPAWSTLVDAQKQIMQRELSDSEQTAIRQAANRLTASYEEGIVFNEEFPFREHLFVVDTLLLIGYEVGNRTDIEIVFPKVLQQLELLEEFDPLADQSLKEEIAEGILLVGWSVVCPFPKIGGGDESPTAFAQLINKELDLNGFTGSA